MEIKCRFILEYRDERDAEIIYRSVKIDDEDFVKSYLDGRRIIAEIDAYSIGSLLHTINDYLACISVAEKVIKTKNS